MDRQNQEPNETADYPVNGKLDRIPVPCYSGPSICYLRADKSHLKYFN